MSALDNRVPPPVLALALAAAMAGGSAVLPSTSFGLVWRAGGAAAFLLWSSLYAPRAIRAFRRVGTTIDPVHVDRATALVTSGVYARTRNPMYVSLALLLLAWAAWLGQAALLIGPVTFVLYITRFQILPEERLLTARFGAEYAAYRARVPRWL